MTMRAHDACSWPEGRSGRAVLFTVLLFLVPGAALAEGGMYGSNGSNGSSELTELVAVADARLDEMRGGFEIDGGLKLSFGIERFSYINGALVSSQTVNVPNLSTTSQDMAGMVADVLARAGVMGLIQNGQGNSFTLNTDAHLTGNVIQNTADNQSIQNKTVINSTVNSLHLLRAINLQSAVQDGIVGGLRR